MVLNEEKAKIISDYLMVDKERAQRLLNMDPEDAAKEMNVAGCDVTAEELVEFGKVMSQVKGNGELSNDELENVAGGLGVIATYAIAAGIAAVVGYGVGRLEKW